ncbi:MAG TPA: hypothetical protein VLA74_11155, partial [Nitrososphaeraceae archaeon]|nr:hypothetical protein [Nitrososphaeraceae archaeon]
MLILPTISVLVSLIAQYFYPKDILFFIVIFFYLLILFIVTIGYSLYPLFVNAEKFFEKVDDKRVIEFEFIKKILLIEFPILIG